MRYQNRNVQVCHSLSQTSACGDDNLVELLTALESEEQLFTIYGLLKEINGRTIAKYIDKSLLEILGCRVTKLENAELAKHICYAFFKRTECIDWWRKWSQMPLFDGMLLAYIFNRMRKKFNIINEPLVGKEYEKLRDQMDEECTRLLENCNRKDQHQTQSSLQMNYHNLLHIGECKGSKIELMEVAYRANALKFLAHPACQKTIDLRWQPSYKLDQASYLVFFYYLCPLLFLHPTKPYIKTKGPGWRRLKMFYFSTSAKYLIHMLLRVVNVVLYAIALIRLSSKSMIRNHYMDYWKQFAVIGLQFMYLVEMGIIAVSGKFMSWSTRNKIEFYRNILISTTFITLIFSQILISTRYYLVPIADACFYLSFLLAVIRSMRILYIDSFFGAIVHMISKMVPIMLKFCLVFLIFWTSFAVCYISLTGHFHHGKNDYYGLAWQIFTHGAFEIFGDVNHADKVGYINGCENYDLSSSTDTSFHCLFRTWMVPLLLFFYMLVSGILLVNILTALLTKEYDKISHDYHLYWKSMLYARLAEYEEKPWFPVFSHILNLCTSLRKKCMKPMRKSSCCDRGETTQNCSSESSGTVSLVVLFSV